MTHALSTIVEFFPAWPSVARLVRAAVRVSLPPRVSAAWLVEFEITSSKRRDE